VSALDAATALLARGRAAVPGARTWIFLDAEILAARAETTGHALPFDDALAAIEEERRANGDTARSRALEGALLLARARSSPGDLAAHDAAGALDAFAAATRMNGNLAHGLAVSIDDARRLAGR
jgi:hypothetical protein